MKYNVVIADTARDDLKEIKQHFTRVLKSPEIGKNILQEIKSAMKSLDHLALRHTVNDHDFAARGIRAFPVGNYIIFYIVIQHTVSVIRVIHSSRNWIDLI